MNLPLAHGESTMEWQDDILIIRAYDAFNLEGILRSKDQLIKAVNDRVVRYPRKPWGRLAIIDENAFPTFDSCEIVKETFQWVMQRGCVAAALVTDHIPLYKKMFSDVSLCIGFFSNEEEAKKWLRHQIEQACPTTGLTETH